ncbi:LuxR family transcriptional regulator (plasmid) [Phyllobacterium sp. 628]|uniref:helix-turn-helix transcriptional regulator n=1 Tax=Phyllobacterium sp. 628 TaxID=2718938 RepID=UPI0016627400|nr:LuxR C-terminal-related transcriptional regulator [Phyllobacterium sp. 628]QND50627.1 LuxR family transcriptional regulator [Phyllobacterium sp. 628]
MNLELTHFPDFQKGLFKETVAGDTLEMLRDVKHQVDCQYLAHIGHPEPRPGADVVDEHLPLLTTYPVSWMLRYFAKDYIKIDPIMQGMSLFPPRADAPGTIRNLTSEPALAPAATHYFRDAQRRGLGNLYLAVCATNPFGFRGITLFTFDTGDEDQTAFIERKRKQLSAASARVHNALHGSRNPALAAIIANLLTKREIDCLFWAANGKTDGEIGEILNIARWTVVTYLQNAKNKLGCSNRTSTVATALALGVIDIPAVAKAYL